MSSRNLPADMWRLLAPRANHKTLLALRGVSSQARLGVANQYAKHSTLATAYRSATATTIRPLVAALRAPFKPGAKKVVKIGKYDLTVDFDPLGVVIVIWYQEMPAEGVNNILLNPLDFMKSVGYYDMELLSVNQPSPVQIRAMGRGGATVVRLVRAAFKAAYGV